VLVIAFAWRLVIAIGFPNVIGADEVFQFLEQAHRLVFGSGVVPWEFQIGLRNWLIPLLLAAPMAAIRQLDPDPMAGLIVIRVLLCAASLPIVWCAAKWGEQYAGPRGVWIAGLFTAFWPDLWLMAPHPLEEVFAADLLVPVLYLLGRSHTLGRVAWAGCMLGLIFTLRMQLAPAVAIIGIALCGRDPARWRVALLAAALPVLAAGMLDWFTWGQPFRSFWLNIYINMDLHVAEGVFGAASKYYFLDCACLDWLLALPFLLYLGCRGTKQLPVAGLAALSIIIVHTLIAHKEFRFIFPAIAVLVPLAGVGLAGMVADLPRLSQGSVVVALLAGPFFSPLTCMMLCGQTNAFHLFRSLAQQQPCLISLQTWHQEFVPIPLMFVGRTRLTGQTINHDGATIIEADSIVASDDQAIIPPGFRLQACTPGGWVPFRKPGPRLCLWHRNETSCPAGPVAPFNLAFPAAAIPFIIADRLTG